MVIPFVVVVLWAGYIVTCDVASGCAPLVVYDWARE
jgi:hypothetical protein